MSVEAPGPRSDHRRLTVAWTAVLVLLTVGLILGLRTEVEYRRQQVSQARVQAEVVADSIAAALAFSDIPTANQYVGAFRANPQVAEVSVYDTAKRRLATYAAAGVSPRDMRQAVTPRFRGGSVELTVPVAQNAEPLGLIYLRTKPERWTAVLGRHSSLALLTLMGLLLVWYGVHSTEQLTRQAGALSDANVRLLDEIQERAKAEEALRQSQKMEVLGQLTGGVAHDFNNLLTVIMGGLETIGRQLEKIPGAADNVRISRALDMSLHGAERAATLTQRLLAFSRRQPLQPRPLDTNRLVSGMADLLQRTLGETVKLECVLGAGAWQTRADPAELENALLNLAVNARDAMPGGGKLTIETSNAHLDEAYVGKLPEATLAGQYTLIAVTDTGEGMSRETLAKVFEPFFTTKEVGKGTGLGLSQVYGFVRQSNGHVTIYSELGQGTTIKIYLPRWVGEVTQTEAAAATPAADLTGHETVLVVEDHPELQAYSVGILRELGYRVLQASDAAEARKVLAQEPQISLLFTDVVLPGGVNGRQLADEATRARPDLQVLYTTGYTRNAIVHNGALDAGVALITKPFTFQALAAKVRQVLDKPAKAAEPADTSSL